ncbi:MAG: helix-hairpin-helix domain-containing protein [Planctomycetota bacterium]|nr:helix-hairpin-helix domain-containing protein [Planctomycetota bacterium]
MPLPPLSRSRLPELWTRLQQRGLIAIFSVILIVLGIRLAMNRAMISDPPPARGPAAEELADRLDPNTATAAEFAAISGLGEKRAAAIVEYRSQFVASHPGQRAFGKPTDLEHIRGIGPATMELLEAYLVFPNDPATRP